MIKLNKLAVALGCVSVLCGTATFAQAQTLLNENTPGSVLVIPKFDIRGDTSTQIRLVNNDGRNVEVTLNYVCPGVKNVNQFCAALNRVVTLTPHQTRVIDVADQNPPCNQGYAVAYASRNGYPVGFNALTGSYNITSGRRVEAENAIAIQKLGRDSDTQSGAPTLRFDGVNYAAMPSSLSTDFRAVNPGSEGSVAASGSVVTLLTLDTLAGMQNPPAYAFVDFWNSAEEPFSSSVEFVCWTEKQLDAIDSNFLEENLGTTYGSLKITPFPNCPIPGTCPPLPAFDATMLGQIQEYGDGDVGGRLLVHDSTPKATAFQTR